MEPKSSHVRPILTPRQSGGWGGKILVLAYFAGQHICQVPKVRRQKLRIPKTIKITLNY